MPKPIELRLSLLPSSTDDLTFEKEWRLLPGKTESSRHGKQSRKQNKRHEKAVADPDDEHQPEAVQTAVGSEHHAAKANHRGQRRQHNRVHRARRHAIRAALAAEVVHHVDAIVDGIEERLRERLGLKAKHVEGLRPADWVLMDYIDFVVHVFLEAKRDFYRLERLWGDAPQLELSDPSPPSRDADASA